MTDFRKHLRGRETAVDVIRHGKLPTIEQLFAGMPFFADSLDRDIQVWLDEILPGISSYTLACRDELGPALERLRQTLELSDIDTALEIADRMAPGQWSRRLLVYSASSGSLPSRLRLASVVLSSITLTPEMDKIFVTAVGNGASVLTAPRCSCVDFLSEGMKHLERRSAELEAFHKAMIANDTQPPVDDTDAVLDTLRAVMEDRSEVVPAPPRRRPSIIVVPAQPAEGKRDVWKAWTGTAGRPLPLVTRGDLAEHRAALQARWPHAMDLVDLLLGDLASRDPVRFRPTLIVGPPGCGKSTLAREVGQTVGLAVELVSLAGSADGSLGGTSAQWTTARESIPLQLIRRSQSANPLLIWDEIEKASPSRHNGSALDALLPLLEPGQARNFRDPALEVECDLSWVSHLATANDLDTVPGPLRDRMRIVKMPEPGWQHLGDLVRGIVGDIAAERGIDPRWIAPLAQDEVEIVKRAWPGGSLRQLRRIVGVLIDGREQQMGRA